MEQIGSMTETETRAKDTAIRRLLQACQCAVDQICHLDPNWKDERTRGVLQGIGDDVQKMLETLGLVCPKEDETFYDRHYYTMVVERDGECHYHWRDDYCLDEFKAQQKWPETPISEEAQIVSKLQHKMTCAVHAFVEELRKRGRFQPLWSVDPLPSPIIGRKQQVEGNE